MHTYKHAYKNTYKQKHACIYANKQRYMQKCIPTYAKAYGTGVFFTFFLFFFLSFFLSFFLESLPLCKLELHPCLSFSCSTQEGVSRVTAVVSVVSPTRTLSLSHTHTYIHSHINTYIHTIIPTHRTASAQSLPSCQLITLPGKNVVPWESPRESAAAILDFCTTLK